MTAESVGRTVGHSVNKTINFTKGCIEKSLTLTKKTGEKCSHGTKAVKHALTSVTPSPVKKFWSGFRSAN